MNASIVRRKEFKRAREYRRRARKRKPFMRALKLMYKRVADSIRFTTEEMSWFRRLPQSEPLTTPITEQSAVLVNYGGSAGAPLLHGNKSHGESEA